MENFKLTIDLLPKGAWGNDFSKKLPQKEWDKIRKFCYKKANNKCEICGYKTNELDAHEVWDFNIEDKTQTLVDIVGICSKCHGVKHIRNSERLGYGENAKRHFISVNNCSELDFANHLTKALLEFEKRNKVYRWKIKANLTKFGVDNSKIKEYYIPKIINPYTQTDIENLKNSCSLSPRILEIDVNNYDGTINIICDKTNKIEWFADKLIETKYNFGRTFRTKFCVKDLKCKKLYFKLSGAYGETVSEKFKLTDFY